MDEKRSIGNWFITPQASTFYTITYHKREDYIVNEFYTGHKEFPWQIQWDDSVIDLEDDISLNDEALSRCTWGGKVPKTIMDQFSDARFHARLRRGFR